MERVPDLITPAGPATLIKKLLLLIGSVRFQESVFALPFAYTGMVLAADGLPHWRIFAWITVAMVSARTLGMSANRILDRHIDAQNQRTARRHLPSGRLRVSDMMVLAALSLGVFLLASSQLNLLALTLAPVAAVYLIVYPFAKRFTWTASLVLGGALAIAPSGAWIGVEGSLDWRPVMLSIAVALWATSFDIIYHTQDTKFYTAQGLHSVAQRFGVATAFWWARIFDVLAFICFVGLGSLMRLTFPYFLGCAIVLGLLVYKYILISPDDLSRISVAFFRINAYVSIVVFVATLIAILVV